MKVLEATEIRIELADLERRCFHPRPPFKRSPGLHLSQILRWMAIKMRILKPGEPLEEDLPNIMALGMAWEEFAATLYPDMVWQPGEVQYDGIYMNPDGISTLEIPDSKGVTFSYRAVLDEFKFTSKKVRSASQLKEEWLWMNQLMNYQLALGADLSRLHVMYYNGTWEGRREPVYMRYLIQFDRSELESSRQAVVKWKGKVEPEK